MSHPLLSYATLYLALKIAFAVIFVLWLLVEFIEWRTRRKWPAWLAKDLKARGIHIDAEPEADPRSSIEAFHKMFREEKR